MRMKLASRAEHPTNWGEPHPNARRPGAGDCDAHSASLVFFGSSALVPLTFFTYGIVNAVGHWLSGTMLVSQRGETPVRVCVVLFNDHGSPSQFVLRRTLSFT